MTLNGLSTRTAPDVGVAIDPAGEALSVSGATVMQLTLETPFDVAHSLLPQALHPVNPAVLVVTAFAAPDSQWGEFNLVEVALQCRAGARARRFLLSTAVSKQEVADVLRSRWGVAAKVAEIEFEERYEGVAATVVSDGGVVLRARMVDKDPVAPSAVAFFAGLAPARIDGTDQLVQIERDFELYRGDRGRPRVEVLDSAWWTDGQTAELLAAHPVSGATLRADVKLKPVRFLIDPTEPGSLSTSRLDTVAGS